MEVRGFLASLSKYAAVGASATFAHFLFLWLLQSFMPLSPIIEFSITYSLAFFVSFAGHDFYTFRIASKMLSSFIRFASLSLASFLVSLSLLFSHLQISNGGEDVATFIFAALIPVINFFGSKVWAFKNT